jgi:hypothetical protein
MSGYARVLLNSNSLFTSPPTAPRHIVSDTDGVVEWPAETEVWRMDPLQSGDCKQWPLLGNARKMQQ